MSLTTNNYFQSAPDFIVMHVQLIHLHIESPPILKIYPKKEIHQESNVYIIGAATHMEI